MPIQQYKQEVVFLGAPVVYCTHPSVLEKLCPSLQLLSRLIGLKANLPFSNLDALLEAHPDEPEVFALFFGRNKEKNGFEDFG
ncbi:hypothetical protein [Candidiatus Paracoxiella cheracis]|uniref:hypothetical protein n=1 Tax=Candidiatus Paracoxiella cheracis TaxID=3405120 RepID=UPI003BF53CC3